MRAAFHALILSRELSFEVARMVGLRFDENLSIEIGHYGIQQNKGTMDTRIIDTLFSIRSFHSST